MARAPRQPVPVASSPDGEPIAFVWHGVTHGVAQVIGQRHLRDEGWALDAAHGQGDCYFYLVITPDWQIFELCEDRAWEPPMWTLDRIVDKREGT